MSLIQYLARSGLGKVLRLQHLCSAGSLAQRPLNTSNRSFSTLDQYQSDVDAINEKFVEARDEIEYAMEDAETVYFNESAFEAKEVVQETLDMYQALLEKLDPQERGKLERSMGLKMEQLKAEAAQLDTLHVD